MKRRALVLALAGLVVSALALLLAFCKVHVAGGLRLEPRVHAAALGAALRGVKPGWLAGYALLNVTTLGLRAWQLRALARRRDGAPPHFSACYQAVAVAMMAQNLLPGRLSEALRVVTLARADDVRTSSATGAVVFGRVLDLLALLAAISVPLLLIDSPATRARSLHLVAELGLVAVVLLGALLVVFYFKRVTLTAWAARVWPRLAPIVEGFAEGLSALADRRRLAVAVLASLACPLALAASYGCALAAFGLGGLPAGSALLLTAAILCAIAVPAAPSSLGVYHAAATWTLVSLGAPPASAAAFALATHAISVVSFVALGGAALAQLGGRALLKTNAPTAS
jgi:glycosyltransferase 2 family protein